MTNKYDNGQTFFECVICDFDSALFRAAQYVEETYVTVKCKRSGEELTFPNKTTFWGTKKNTIGGEVGKWTSFLGIATERDDFEITEHVKIKDDFSADPVGEAFKEFNRQVGKIKNAHFSEGSNYKLLIGGTVKNFRFEAAKIQPYKGKRKEKPLVFAELKEKVIAQYGDKVVLAEGCEADDVMGWYATENQKHFNETGEYKYLLGYIDKDLKQLWGATVNLDHLKNGIKYITPDDAVDFFCRQLGYGDKSVDNIQGLPDLNPITRQMYGIRNGKGCGEVAVGSILESAKTPLEKFLRIADAYKKYYGADTIHTLEGGEQYTWKDFLRENAILLWMQRFPNQMYDIIDFLENKVKVNLDELNLVLEEDEKTKEKKIVNKPIKGE